MAFQLTPLRQLLIAQFGTRSDAIDQVLKLEREVKRAVWSELYDIIEDKVENVFHCLQSYTEATSGDIMRAIDAAEAEFCGEETKPVEEERARG